MQSSRSRGGGSRVHAASAWIALTAGAISAVAVSALVVDAIRSYDDRTARVLIWTIGASAAIALAAAGPGLRRRRWRPIAMEGIELAFVGVFALALIAFFVYVVLDGYAG